MARGTRRKPRRKTNDQHRFELAQHLTRRGPGGESHAPTPERVNRAAEHGEIIRAKVIYTESGFPTADFYWQITPVIDDLKRRGTITAEEYEAAFRFMRHWHNGIHRGPPTVSYAPRYDGAVRDLTPVERQWHYSQLAKRAFLSVDRKLQPALAWLVQALGDPLPLKTLGAYYAPDKGSQTQSSQGAIVLRLACADLCSHYGIDHQLTKQRVEMLAENLLAKMTIAASS